MASDNETAEQFHRAISDYEKARCSACGREFHLGDDDETAALRAECEKLNSLLADARTMIAMAAAWRPNGIPPAAVQWLGRIDEARAALPPAASATKGEPTS